MDDRHDGRRERVGQNAHAYAARAQISQQFYAPIAGDEIRGDNHQVLLDFAYRCPELAAQQRSRLFAGLDFDLFGAVVDQLRFGPYQLRACRCDTRQRLVGRKAPQVIGALHLAAVLRKLGSIQVELLRIGLFDSEAFDGNRKLTVPVVVEAFRLLPHQRSGGHDVGIAELSRAAGLEIFVADVPAAQKRDRVVRDVELVVHAVIEARAGKQEFGIAQHVEDAARIKRIEDTDLYVLVRRQRGDLLVALGVVAVVDEHAHAHAAVGGAQYRIHQQLPGIVVLDDEVLEVERLLRRVGHFSAYQETVHALDQQPEAGQAGMLARLGIELPPQTRRLGVRERGRCLLWIVRSRQCRTAGNEQDDKSKREESAHRYQRFPISTSSAPMSFLPEPDRGETVGWRRREIAGPLRLVCKTYKACRVLTGRC